VAPNLKLTLIKKEKEYIKLDNWEKIEEMPGHQIYSLKKFRHVQKHSAK
jgi:hypothetical protein